MVQHKTVSVDGLSVFYREAGDADSPKIILLGGFPASSHQFRNLIPALADRFHVISPDYPGFGNTDLPDPARFAYTFDRLSEIVEGLLIKTSFGRFGLFMHDYGGPVGMRVISRHPSWAEWLILQNSNAYEEGFTPAWDGIRHALWKHPGPESEKALMPFLQLEGIKMAYLHGHKHPELISPDNWNMDFRFMERPNARRAQLDLFYDYRKNVELYPQWQRLLRERQPKTLIFWGQNDIFFTPEGGEAYLRDLPDAEMHRLDSGHFALEDCLDEIASGIRRFYDEKVASPLRKVAHKTS
ncbi:MAG TPA: alpha/beta hydrolase [Acidobacteriota bacterium]|nr:alpha/beta hydrolase [Acidobacteriota bacterium]